MECWRKSLETLVLLYEIYRLLQRYFWVQIGCFFIVLTLFCYWLANSTLFTLLLVSPKTYEYFLLQVLVGILGATFDTISLFITIWIARNTLNSKSMWPFFIALES
jgi:hypothetical protein